MAVQKLQGEVGTCGQLLYPDQRSENQVLLSKRLHLYTSSLSLPKRKTSSKLIAEGWNLQNSNLMSVLKFVSVTRSDPVNRANGKRKVASLEQSSRPLT